MRPGLHAASNAGRAIGRARGAADAALSRHSCPPGWNPGHGECRAGVHPPKMGAACGDTPSAAAPEARSRASSSPWPRSEHRPAAGPANAVESTVAPTKGVPPARRLPRCGSLSRHLVAGPAAGGWGTAGRRGECGRDYMEPAVTRRRRFGGGRPGIPRPPGRSCFVTNAGGPPSVAGSSPAGSTLPPGARSSVGRAMGSPSLVVTSSRGECPRESFGQSTRRKAGGGGSNPPRRRPVAQETLSQPLVAAPLQPLKGPQIAANARRDYLGAAQAVRFEASPASRSAAAREIPPSLVAAPERMANAVGTPWTDNPRVAGSTPAGASPSRECSVAQR